MTVVSNLLHGLQIPDTRMQAITDLIRFAGPTFLYNRGGSMAYEALLFLGFNGSRAPMWRFNYDKRIFGRVIELTRCDDRQVAEWATGKLQQLLESRNKP